MRQLTMGLAALMLFLVPSVAPRAADAPAEPIESVMVLAVEGDVFIGADGGLANYKIDTPAPGDTAARVEAIVRGWRFEPVLVEGKPQAVVARMRVALAATKSDADLKVRVDHVSFPGITELARERAQAEHSGPMLPRHLKRPEYPPGLQRTGIAGRVLVALRYDDAGQVTDVTAVQSMLFDRDPRESPKVTARAIELFEESALSAARAWRIESPTAGKQRIAVTAVEFLADMRDKRSSDGTSLVPGSWRMVSRTPKRYVEWLDTRRAAAPSVSDVDAGQLLPVAEASLKLRDDVVGTLL